jgi:hypothetical protein
MRWGDILRAIEDVRNDIKSIPQLDIAPILDGFRELSRKIDEKPVTEPTDISPILTKLDEKEESDDTDHEELKSILDEILEEIKKYAQKVPADVQNIMKKARFEVKGELSPEGFKEEENKDESSLPDISKLLS